MTMRKLRVLEICAGAGGQALGLEQAGFEHEALVEIDPDACDTLRANRPGWKVIEGDIRDLDGCQFRGPLGTGIDLLAGGVPCQPFSVGGKQLGADDERDLFQEALRLVHEARPRAVMLENVPGLAQARFLAYRQEIIAELEHLGYALRWETIRSCDYGVPQLRPRVVLIALKERYWNRFTWPAGAPGMQPSVSTVLYDLMAARGWEGAYGWAILANQVAPTIVGGSKKHGGPDLGPTRARAAWKVLGVNGSSIAEYAPGPDEPGDHMPRLTIPMVARIQGFPDEWMFSGRKTAAYRQVGNAFPPPVARAFGTAIRRALTMEG
jgi:DNA (cytosine-5)-methyltransferase 1